MPRLHIYKNEKETCYAFAEWLAEFVNETLAKQDMFTIALSGGEIPKLLYKILAEDFITKMDWSKIHVFWADQKLLSFSDEKDHDETALKACLNDLPVPKDQIHTIRTDVAPEDAAAQYESLLRSYFTDNEKTFDLVILGMGEQGNLLSLLPNPEENIHRDGWVISVYDKQEDLFKITLTINAINASSVKALLVTGKRKEEVVQHVLKGKYDPEKYPAQLIVTANKVVHWFLDEGAASKLIKPSS